MIEKRDIETRADIDLLLTRFYARAFSDEVIGYIFKDVARLDLEHHLPIIGDFWESVLLEAKAYQKRGRNPLEIHRQLHLKSPLNWKHFRRWLLLFNITVDESFAGERAEFAKLRAEAIANRMQNYINGVPAGGFP